MFGVYAYLNLLQDDILEAADLLALLLGDGLTVQAHQGTQVELGRLQQLNFSNVNVLQGEDSHGRLLNLAANDLRDQLLGQLGQGHVRDLSLHDLDHLFADLSQLGGLSVSGLLDLVGLSLSESNGENTQDVVVRGLNGNISLDEGLPLADKRSQLVGGEVHAVEVGQQVLTLDLIDSQLDLSVRVVLRALQVSEADLDDAALQAVGGVLKTGGTVDEGLTNVSVLESGGGLDVKPVLSGEGVYDLFLQAFAVLGRLLVLTNSHDCSISV